MVITVQKKLAISRLATVIAVIFLLVGCGFSEPSDGEASTVNLQNVESTSLKLCQDELEALNKVDAGDYEKYKKEFDRLMYGAAQYSGLRDMVGMGTRKTVDALYHYKVNLLCAGVSQAMLEGLAEQGERS